MQIRCPECELKIPAADVNINRLVAKCTSCDRFFSFVGQLDNYQEPDSFKFEERLPAPQPSTIETEVNGDQLILRRRWSSAHGHIIPALVCTLIFMLSLWRLLAILIGHPSAEGSISGSLFITVQFGFGATLFAYPVLMRFLNTTTIVADRFELSIEHSPLSPTPWKRPSPIASENIRQLYCTLKRSQNSTSYTVNGIVRGEHVQLLSNLGDLDEALYIEQEVEAHLGIRDEAVPGSIN